ncbi:unnamed protein product [Rotaria magnacalcarata]|uniref:DDE-1 domain-containing protein n=2 Tax=Rotaria magnacalcarata TaxID=392030 RepID=A0A816FGN2_9BILA|nr:unnamed protein product [Rotaria magnacalcarata]
MTCKIFTEWLQDLDLIMRKQKRHILLFLDNAPVHPPDVQLENIKLDFFPPNTTAKIQPIDQGVIRAFKAYYRRHLVKHIIASADVAVTADDINITALDSIDDSAPPFNEWDDSNNKLLVINGIINDDADSNEDQLNDDVPSEDPPSLSECLDLVHRLRLFSTMQQPELHLFIIELQSKLTDTLLDSNLSKQRSVLDYFKYVLV